MPRLISPMSTWMVPILLLLPGPLQAVAPPVQTHPIYQTPDLTYPNHVRIRKLTEEVINPRIDEPRWSFRFVPDRKRYLVGEPITGRLTVENASKEWSIRFSPPYRGYHVSTVAVWASQRNDDGSWGALTRVLRLNNNRADRAHTQFQGEPVVVPPGGHWSAHFAVNGMAWDEYYRYDPQCRPAPLWVSAGFARPGTYRISLQYANLERIMSFARRGKEEVKADEKTNERDGNRIMDLSDRPVVLGPYQVEIEPLEGKGSAELRSLIASWTRVFEEFESDQRFSFGGKDLTELLDMDVLDTKSRNSLRAALTLAQIQGLLLNPPEKADEKAKYLGAALKQLRTERASLPAGFLRDLYGLAECHVLANLGRHAEADALARLLNTPDANVFLHDHKNGPPLRKPLLP
jgi:hypothetical protein